MVWRCPPMQGAILTCRRAVSSARLTTVNTKNIAQEFRQLQQMLEDFGIQTDILENALEQPDMLQQQFDQLESM